MLRLRLLGVGPGNEVLIVSARIGGLNVVPVALGAIELSTHAEASFGEGATLASVPVETIDAGAEIAYTLSLRNCATIPNTASLAAASGAASRERRTIWLRTP